MVKEVSGNAKMELRKEDANGIEDGNGKLKIWGRQITEMELEMENRNGIRKWKMEMENGTWYIQGIHGTEASLSLVLCMV